MKQVGYMRMIDKVAIVTGAGQFIGRSIALRFAEEGADVVVDDIVLERANRVAEEIRGLGRKALAIGADVTKNNEVEAMVKTTLDEFGKIDILVNNARAGGRAGGTYRKTFFIDLTEEAWDNTIAGCLKSVRNCSRAVITHMMERKSGKIINISSGAGVRGAPGMVDYSTAKAAIIHFTAALSTELADYGIRVNCVSPGPTGAATSQPPDIVKGDAKASGLGRQGTPEEVAALVVFLASDEADFISGQNYMMAGIKH